MMKLINDYGICITSKFIENNVMEKENWKHFPSEWASQSHDLARPIQVESSMMMLGHKMKLMHFAAGNTTIDRKPTFNGRWQSKLSETTANGMK